MRLQGQTLTIVVHSRYVPYTEKINRDCATECLLEVRAVFKAFLIVFLVYLEGEMYLLVITCREEADLPERMSGCTVQLYVHY